MAGRQGSAATPLVSLSPHQGGLRGVQLLQKCHSSPKSSGGRADRAQDPESRKDGSIVGMSRVRTGLTGLGLVFLVMVLASLLFATSETDKSPPSAGEPLAVLGVAPGTGDKATADPVPLPSPAKKPIRHDVSPPEPVLTEI